MAAKSMEVSVTVNINGKQANRDVQDFERRTNQSFSRIAKAGAAALGFFYGGIARQAGTEMARMGDILGRGTPVGAEAGKFWGRLGAANNATDKTVESLGMAGSKASKENILAVYNMHKMMETLSSDSKARVTSVIGEHRMQQLLEQISKDMKFTASNLSSVIQELGRLVRSR